MATMLEELEVVAESFRDQLNTPEVRSDLLVEIRKVLDKYVSPSEQPELFALTHKTKLGLINIVDESHRKTFLETGEWEE